LTRPWRLRQEHVGASRPPSDVTRDTADAPPLCARRIWEWGVAEPVASGLQCTRINLQPLGRQMLEAADRLATL
jgi:hypothetical protein